MVNRQRRERGKRGVNREEGAWDSSVGGRLREMFHLLKTRFGPQQWWPADTPLEVMVGAVLTQNTNWKNVEKAILNLKKKDLLSLERLYGLAPEALAHEIRPAGYYNIKARRLKNLMEFVMTQYQGDLEALKQEALPTLRQGLLSVNGVGPETADSILLYALHRPVFVVDAYTHRILIRHAMADEQATYQDLQELFVMHLPDDPSLYNEFHALIVQAGKHYCRKKPLCESCPLKTWGNIPVASDLR